MFGNIGMWELILILFVVMLLFGARRLPEIGASLGKGIREFKSSVKEIESSVNEIEGEVKELDQRPGETPSATRHTEATPDETQRG